MVRSEGGKGAGGKGKETREDRRGVQETTGMCRMAGGWPEVTTKNGIVGE